MSRGPWIETQSGGRFFLLDPRPHEVRAVDICFALSHLVRYTGHAGPYNVAQHSLWVGETLRAWKYNRETVLAGLLHDGHEAYTNDISGPMKEAMSLLGFDIGEIERPIQAAIHQRFRLDLGKVDFAAVKRADEVLLMTEKRDILKSALSWGERWVSVPPLKDHTVKRREPKLAEMLLRETISEYGGH